MYIVYKNVSGIIIAFCGLFESRQDAEMYIIKNGNCGATLRVEFIEVLKNEKDN